MGPLCGSCKEGYGRESDQCKKCAPKSVREFLLILMIVWVFAFLSYFIRSVLQLAQRIEFNRKFNKAPSEHQQRFIEMVTGVQIGPVRERIPQTYEAGAGEIMPEGPSQHPNALSSMGSNARKGLSPVSRKDLARLAANQLQRTRAITKSDPQENRAELQGNPGKIGKKKGLMAAKLENFMEKGDAGEFEPLTLANPVSEVLKVHFLSHSNVLNALLLDFDQFPSSYGRCRFH